MIYGYVTRGTTVHGKTVNEGELHELADQEFRTLSLAGFIRKATPEELAKLHPSQPAPAKPVTQPKGKN